ncbi:protein charybde-like [Anthonomus grandis grandis]|uniref:protein charybde-like n=1 Tax=Anthonomus grandis grandis TaxID=2921223 RepID=UPI002165399F|nr:protein charybde-like [Anthonomus grandis grandis]
MEVLSINNNQKYSIEEEWDASEYLDSNAPAVIEALSKRLEAELKDAKNTHLMVEEVLLPNGLTRRIAQDIFKRADNEPYGLRGCILKINFETEGVTRKISAFHCDPTTPATFEIYLTLKQNTASWNHFLPQFLKKITSGPVIISPDYQVELKKLYRSSLY